MGAEARRISQTSAMPRRGLRNFDDSARFVKRVFRIRNEPVKADVGLSLSVEQNRLGSKSLLVLLLLAPVMSGCGSSLSDFTIKDQEWFQRPGKIFGTKSLAIETPPLSPEKSVMPDDLITAEGACPGMAPVGLPGEANAQQNAEQQGTADGPTGAVALGHTECDVARAIGSAPDNVNLSNNQRGDRLATVTYLHGQRPGLYTFTAGRLTSVERVAQPAPARPAAKKKRAS